MCGILGTFSENVDQKEFKDSLNLMKYRGPDAVEFYFDRNVSLGHRRLSIIDLSKNGKQPMANEDGTILVVFNGEIYNFKEIKAGLKKKHDFISESDTEVLLHAYEEWGTDFIKKLNGMFAFCIYDSKKKEFILARDRSGIKPLYYYKDQEKFIFSSEIKSILEFDVKKKLNEKILYDYFNYLMLTGRETFFQDIYSFPPGYYAIIGKNKFLFKEYYDNSYGSSENTLEENSKKLNSILLNCVKDQMISDVPVGAFLSGGIDSSTIVALEKKFSKELHTFTAGFDVYPEEIEAGEFISSEIGTVQHSISINSEMFIKELPNLIWHYDHPMSFASSVPLYFVSKLAKDKVKVILTGEGADELFAGYRRYRLIDSSLGLNKKMKMIPFKKNAFEILENKIHDPRYKKILSLSFQGMNYDYITGINALIGKERERLLLVKKEDVLNQKIKEIFLKKQTSMLNRLLYLDFKTYLAELLMKQDRMSMAASIESRVPFLDNRMIDFANQLPDNQKLNGKVGKFILRKTVKDIVPEKVIKRKKVGFTVPLDIWFRKELNGYLKDELNSEVVKKYFNYKEVETLIEKQKTKNCSLQLWAILNFKVWHEKFISN